MPVIRPDGKTWASRSATAKVQWSMVGVAWASAMASRMAGMRAFLWAHNWRASASNTARASISEKSLDMLGVNSRHATSRRGRAASGRAMDFMMGRIVSRWAGACVCRSLAQGRLVCVGALTQRRRSAEWGAIWYDSWMNCKNGYVAGDFIEEGY